MSTILILACCLGDETLLTGIVKTAVKSRPKLQKEIEGDEKCKCLHESTPKRDDLVIGADGGVKWAFVRVTKGLEGKTFAPPKEASVIDQKGCMYTPHVVGVMTGQPLEVRSSDDMLHNVHGLPFDNKPFNFGQFKGSRNTLSFGRPEIFKVKCDVHGWMGAWIGVFEHPYFAVTDEAGRYAIKGLPPGKYTLEAWHEQLKGKPMEIEVKEKETKAPDVELAEK